MNGITQVEFIRICHFSNDIILAAAEVLTVSV